MTEEAKPESPESKEPAGPSNSDIRKSDLFKSVTGKQSEEMSALQEKFDALQQSIADSKEEERVNKLKASENWEQLEAENKQTIANMESAHKRQIAELELANKLTLEMREKNPVWLKGAMAMYDGEQPADEFIETLKADDANKPIFEGLPASGQPSPDTAVPGVPGSKISGSQLEAMRQSPDKEQRVAAMKYTEAYLAKHGNLDGLHK